MARIVKLAQVLPDDITFEMPDGSRFTAPGDPPLQLILTIAHLFEQAQGGEDQEAVGLDVLEKLDAEVLRLLRMRDAELERSPFGVFGVQAFVTELLASYQFGELDEDPSTPSETRAKAKPRKPATSKRSSGSPSS